MSAESLPRHERLRQLQSVHLSWLLLNPPLMRYGATVNRCFIKDNFAPRLGEIFKTNPRALKFSFYWSKFIWHTEDKHPMLCVSSSKWIHKEEIKSEASIMAAFRLKMLTTGQPENKEPDPWNRGQPTPGHPQETASSTENIWTWHEVEVGKLWSEWSTIIMLAVVASSLWRHHTGQQKINWMCHSSRLFSIHSDASLYGVWEQMISRENVYY